MTGAKKLNLVTIEEYLSGEENSTIKHEFVGGTLYAMVGARNAHNIISGNAFASLWSSLKGKQCQPYNSDTKIRLRMPTEVRFYYPDVSVVCHANRQTESFQDEPVVVIEVLSQGTRRIDEGEKKDAYMTIPSLQVYIMVEQETSLVVAWRRSKKGFAREEYRGVESVVPLSEIETNLPMGELYAGVEFTPEIES